MTLLAAAEDVASDAGDFQLVLAAILGIAVVVVLITWLKVHPFLALILGSLLLGIIAGLAFTDTITSFQAGVGATVGNVGVLIALGAMIGGLLAESGGADRVVSAFVDRVSARRLPWAMAGVAALIGIPLFFEVGVVLLIPIVLLVARRTSLPVLAVGIPALAGLSVLHGLVPPHPGPLVAIDALDADLGPHPAVRARLCHPLRDPRRAGVRELDQPPPRPARAGHVRPARERQHQRHRCVGSRRRPRRCHRG
jgi:gluconate:H+ symporter, GntP family